MIRITAIIGTLILIQISLFQTAFAGQPVQAYHGGGGGGEVPTPFEAANQTFDLADGEIYLLSGRVLLLPSLYDGSGRVQPYFKINLEHTPWLNNPERAKTPFYLLEGSVKDWIDWNRFPVRLLCKAHGHIIVGKDGLQYVITLEPLE